MQEADSDTTCLCLLDFASSLRRIGCSFVDDCLGIAHAYAVTSCADYMGSVSSILRGACGAYLVFRETYQLNAGSWMPHVSGCFSAPRVVFLRELGFHDRLSAIVWARAIMVRPRSRADPPSETEHAALTHAHKETSSWFVAEAKRK